MDSVFAGCNVTQAEGRKGDGCGRLGFLCINRAVPHVLQGTSQVYCVTLIKLLSMVVLQFPST